LFFEIARVLVRLDHVASLIVNANHSLVGTGETGMVRALWRKQALKNSN
jgi:hypothetical protein